MDLSILQWIQTWAHPLLDGFFSVFTTLGNHGELWLIIIAVLLYRKKTRLVGVLALIALLLELLIVSGILKPIIMRPRPFTVYPIDLIVGIPSGSSFPSGHAASSFAVAGVLFFAKMRHRWIYIAMATIMAFSRLYVFVHYPSDVLVGSLIGVAIAWCVWHYRKSIERVLLRFTKTGVNSQI
ncbi:phosphatase PAP2 family protein [Erysipelothrix sp. HDW6C]|uniref:phosphatase PAP2 family protein n=1 Tax=Erysipelothrix sp. HDW6C TaxID=2714930 RepID=UPI00140D69A9|nr:phosphatase PAP2 family protein [Erysipelothrix sp. HDW6C]QIK69151.1 phosphatase PAP2 family protein [Erysipelothrix sp. HDW6C]